ncbi:MAG: stalk domain-containing protein [Clostridia bacterium]|nr:stalk domain-containing protein [Clostridia bacterium]
MNIKKMVASATAATLFFTVPVSATVVEFTVGDTDFLTEQGTEVITKTVEAPPYVNESDRTMVPIRAAAEAFGAQVEWNEERNEVTVLCQKEMKLTIDSAVAYVDGEAVSLDSVPVLVNERTFVPLRFVSEAFGYNVQYVASTEQIVIDDSPLIYDFGENIVTVREAQQLWKILKELNGGEVSAYAGEYLNGICIASWFRELFPKFTLTEEDYRNILAAMEADAGSLQSPLTGMNALIYEKNYLLNSDALEQFIYEIYDLENLYAQTYVCAKHVLVEDEDTAREVYEKAVAGEDFDSLIQQYGQDPGMAYYPEGYVFTVGEMVESFEAATYALEVDAISEPVASNFGYHVIKRETLPGMSEETLAGIIERIQMQEMEARNLTSPEMLIEPELLMELLTGTTDEEA